MDYIIIMTSKYFPTSMYIPNAFTQYLCMHPSILVPGANESVPIKGVDLLSPPPPTVLCNMLLHC